MEVHLINTVFLLILSIQLTKFVKVIIINMDIKIVCLIFNLVKCLDNRGKIQDIIKEVHLLLKSMKVKIKRIYDRKIKNDSLFT